MRFRREQDLSGGIPVISTPRKTHPRAGRAKAPESAQPKGKRDRTSCVGRRTNALLTVLLALGFCVAFASTASAIDSGDPAPVFEAPALDGRSVLSLDDYRGKVVLLDFWASWCPPCLESLPQFERLRGAFPAQDFQILAVNIDSNPKNALKFLARNSVGYPNASDPQGLLPKRYQLQTMPTSYIIDRRGIVRYVHNGFARDDIDELHGRIKRMLELP